VIAASSAENEPTPNLPNMKPSIYLKNLQSAANWRAQFNPLRGLTLPHLVALLELGERGDYARLQWLYRFVEKRNSTLRAVLQRRQSSLTRLDWDIRTTAGGGTDPRALAARQAALLRDAYGRVENLREAVTFLALAEFRGYAHLERHADRHDRTIRLQPVPQWFWARLGPDAPWQYNATARPGLPMPGDPVLDPARFIVRESHAPIDEVAVIAHVRQSLSQKDWDAFVETYGLPPLFLELPPDIPAEREAEYQAQADAIIGDARGTVPHGTQIHTVDSGARGQNPFAEHLRYQDELIVLAATGGKLTVLTESGSGTLAGGAHQRTFEDLAAAEAATISEVFQRQFDRPLLEKHFPGEPQLAYFELAANRSLDPDDIINQALTLARAGYEIDPRELSERTGYQLKLRNYALLPLPKPPAPEDETETIPAQNEVR
jgi:phage gp29-like protein